MLIQIFEKLSWATSKTKMLATLYSGLYYFCLICLILGSLITFIGLYFLAYESLFQLGFLKINYVSNLQKRYVLITGCDSGFGFALACSLDEMGCPVFAACLTEEGQRKVTESCSSRLKALQIDVTKMETIKTAYDEVKEALPNPEGMER